MRQHKMNIPTYLENYVKHVQERRLTELSLCSIAGNELLEVWYYGDLFEVKGEQHPYIGDTDVAPEKIVAKDIATGEEILLHDGVCHGYENMFCDTYDTESVRHRPLKKYPFPASRLILVLGYSIDYEDEKATFDVDDDGLVTLIDGRRMAWEDMKRDGFDYIALHFEDEQGNRVQFYERELA